MLALKYHPHSDAEGARYLELEYMSDSRLYWLQTCFRLVVIGSVSDATLGSNGKIRKRN